VTTALSILAAACLAYTGGYLTASAMLTPRIRRLEELVYRLQNSRGWVQ
jgi:hypothetical protein